ncbi:hypothetical protein CKS_4330 [Pantoea stewartii subsp. stewartii DC283]|uniref:Uncharacterized protein n=1 Tax=Pantoea stewartii subsp. stewartii DC283 TaxID=660596 RepID=H3RIL9_PANSE|nr:hypothetical protein CKS_4330 [Pantoea stewartii subsp. stewartii DC283]
MKKRKRYTACGEKLSRRFGQFSGSRLVLLGENDVYYQRCIATGWRV